MAGAFLGWSFELFRKSTTRTWEFMHFGPFISGIAKARIILQVNALAQ